MVGLKIIYTISDEFNYKFDYTNFDKIIVSKCC